MKTLFAFLFTAGLAAAQGQAVNQVDGPSPYALRNLYFRDGSGNLQYLCSAFQYGTASTVTKAATSLTNIIVATNTATVTTAAAHGLFVGARVTVSGATVDTDLNATYTVLTIPSSTTYTFTTANVANATYTDAGLVITTYEPLTTAAVWAIKVFAYTGTNLDVTGWATPSPSLQKPGNAPFGSIACTDRTLY